MTTGTDTKIFWPRDVILGITSRCNFRCSTCNPHRHDAPGQSTDPACYVDMPDEVLFKLEDLLRNAHTVTLGGVGEPMISRNFIQRTDWLRELNPKVQVITFSNGSTLNSARVVEKFAGAINYLHISFNGLSNYEDVMAGGKLETTLHNLELLRDVRRHTGKPQRVELGVVLMRSNLKDLVPLAKLARDLEFDRIAFKDLWVFDQNLKTESLRHDADLAEEIRKQVQLARDVGIPVRCEPWPELSTPILRPGHFLKCAEGAFGAGHMWPNTATVGYWSRLVKDKLDKRIGGNRPWEDDPAFKSTPPCRYPWDMVQVNERGEVLLCCEGMTNLGHIRDKSFLDVWTGDTAAAYRTGMLTGDFHGACRDCKYVNPENTSFMRENG